MPQYDVCEPLKVRRPWRLILVLQFQMAVQLDMSWVKPLRVGYKSHSYVEKMFRWRLERQDDLNLRIPRDNFCVLFLAGGNAKIIFLYFGSFKVLNLTQRGLQLQSDRGARSLIRRHTPVRIDGEPPNFLLLGSSSLSLAKAAIEYDTESAPHAPIVRALQITPSVA